MRPLKVMSPVLSVPILLLPLLAGVSAAEPERYRLERTPDGYVRMDTRTGRMSVCEQRQGELVCRAAADERIAMEDEIERLQGDIEVLEDRVTNLENSLGSRSEQSLTTEEDFERSLGYMERFFRSFMGIVKDFEDEDKKSVEPGSDKT
jgi:hypothetical protein